MDVLKFPSHFPPTGRWKKFFLGVRWLGPDLSFFKDLKRSQANRELELLGQWGGGQRQRVAEAISRVLAHQLGWKSQVFLPEDSVVVCFHGPSFDFCDSDAAFEAVVEVLEKEFDIAKPVAFWDDKENYTMGALVDELLCSSGRV